MKPPKTEPPKPLFAIELVSLPQHFYVSRERLGTCNTVPISGLRYQQSALFTDPTEAKQVADALNTDGEGNEWMVVDVTTWLHPASGNASPAEG